MARDCLVIGINNMKIREKLINVGNDLTAEKVQEITRLRVEVNDRRLSSVLDKIRHYNLQLNPEKCEFRKDCVTCRV
jgi:uncharacterized membrane protein